MATPGKYATGTTVPVEKSRAEIESTLRKYGATAFGSGYERGRSAIMFEAHGRRVRFEVEIPTSDDPAFARFRGSVAPTVKRQAMAAAEERRRWRALLLGIKAKLEAVESEIESFEEAFASHIVLPDGTTVAQHLLPAIEHAYSTGSIGPMLSLGAGR